MEFENTYLWRSSLGVQNNQIIERLRTSYLTFRRNIQGLLDEVRSDFPNLTDHSIDHVDNLWRIASLITGEGYSINPLEGFILGCSFLVHDAVLSYKAFGGKDALRNTIEWKDKYQEIIGTERDTDEEKQKIDFGVIRQLHAKDCGAVISRPFTAMDGNTYFLLTDDEMRRQYGQLIGEIASSHHWDTEQLKKLQTQVNGLAIFPVEWTINPLKLACILRCADAAAIDSGRAPDYLFRLLNLNGVSKNHWVAQNRLGIALDIHDSSRLVFASTHDFEEKDFDAWSVAYDAVKVVDEELDKCQEILSEQDQFQVKSVAGAKSRKTLASYIKTKGWMPSDASVHISDVAHLISTLGGKELYGKDDLQLIVLRELIQNARDAIHARRLMQKDDSIGKICVEVDADGDDVVLSVTDDGVGMSLDTITHSLLDFGNSFWHGEAVNNEFPGLKTAGFKSVGKFGIGFFSVFSIAKSVEVESRKYTDGLNEAHKVIFPKGITLAPIFADYRSTSPSYSTVVKLTLNEKYKEWPIIYVARRNRMEEPDIKVPFAAMLSTLVSGLDVDVYYKEFDNEKVRVHHRIDAKDLDKKAWLRALSLADYQQDEELDDYIETNYNRLQYIYDERNSMAGLAAIGTRFKPVNDFLGGSTIGGLLTAYHSRSGEYWIGVLEHVPDGAKRVGGELKASSKIVESWVNKQVEELDANALKDFYLRVRLQVSMNYFKTDPLKISVASFIRKDNPNIYTICPMNQLVQLMDQGVKLIFVDTVFSTYDEYQGHGDVHLNFNQIAANLNDDEVLFFPVLNSGFLSFRLKDGVPANDYGFLDCLYRTAKTMGHEIVISIRNDYVRSNLGMKDRAIVLELK